MDNIYNDPIKKADFKRLFERAYKKASNTNAPTQDQLAKAFLKFVTETYDLGISLYRCPHQYINYNPNNPTEAQVSNWKRLTLNENHNLDDSQGCN